MTVCEHLKEFIEARAIADPMVCNQINQTTLKGKEMKAAEYRLRESQDDVANRVHPWMSQDMQFQIKTLS